MANENELQNWHEQDDWAKELHVRTGDHWSRLSCPRGVEEAAWGYILPCQWDGGNIDDPYGVHVYAVAIVEDDTPIDNDAPALNQNFCG